MEPPKPALKSPRRPPAEPQPRPSAKPPAEEREVEVEEIELERAMREANRPIPGTLGGDFKP